MNKILTRDTAIHLATEIVNEELKIENKEQRFSKQFGLNIGLLQIEKEQWDEVKKDNSRWIFKIYAKIKGLMAEVSFNLDGSNPKVNVGYSPL